MPSCPLRQVLATVREVSKFPIPTPSATPPGNPEALYGALKVSDPDLSSLWSQQADALRAYETEHRDSSNVALELPTGAGKTLVGLLIAEWRRRQTNARVAYLCPTRQLAAQAAAKAGGYGIDAVLLTGANRGWSSESRLAFHNASSIAISTYAHIFNSASRLGGCETLIFDDAHAGEEPVASAWTISVNRAAGQLYYALLAPLRQALPKSFAAMVSDDTLDPARRQEVEIVLPHALAEAEVGMREALDAHTSPEAEASSHFAAMMIGTHLDSCVAFVSHQRVELRPMVAPTFQLDAFSKPAQRVYMSATLGAAGELERSFGVAAIDRVPAPEGWRRQGSGRRLIVLTDADRDPEELIKEALVGASKGMIIAPSERKLQQLSNLVAPEGFNTYDKQRIEEFKKADCALLAMANRYDGIDMPNDACRVLLLAGLPQQTHLQENFIAERLGARRVLSERIRTRLVQGMGRCTRNRHDYAVVLLSGDDLSEFISREEELCSVRPDLQSELRLAFDYAEDPSVDPRELITAFLDRDESWDPIEAHLQQQAEVLTQELPAGSDVLEKAAPDEVKAWQAAWRGDFEAAVDFGERALGVLDSAGGTLAPWRALWLSLCADWARRCAGDGPDRAQGLERAALAAASGTRWLPTFGDPPPVPQVGTDFDRRAHQAARYLRALGVRGARFEEKVAGMLDRLGSTEATGYEIALLELGQILGFEAARPNDEADPDVAWRDGPELWLVFEAKTEESPDGPLSADDVRQAETHPRWVENELGWTPPEHSVLAIVCPKSTIHSAAKKVAGDQVLVDPATVSEIASRAADAARSVRGSMRQLDDGALAELLAGRFREHRLGDDDLIEALEQRFVRDG